MQIEVDKEDLYRLKINCKGKRTVGQENKGINVEKIIIGLKKLNIKIIKKRRGKKGRRKGKKGKPPQNCKSLMYRQRFIITIKNVTEKKISKV